MDNIGIEEQYIKFLRALLRGLDTTEQLTFVEQLCLGASEEELTQKLLLRPDKYFLVVEFLKLVERTCSQDLERLRQQACAALSKDLAGGLKSQSDVLG
jgi:tRNA(Ser,Leu) C12 N-acetylase TAN1